MFPGCAGAVVAPARREGMHAAGVRASRHCHGSRGPGDRARSRRVDDPAPGGCRAGTGCREFRSGCRGELELLPPEGAPSEGSRSAEGGAARAWLTGADWWRAGCQRSRPSPALRLASSVAAPARARGGAREAGGHGGSLPRLGPRARRWRARFRQRRFTTAPPHGPMVEGRSGLAIEGRRLPARWTSGDALRSARRCLGSPDWAALRVCAGSRAEGARCLMHS